MIICQYRGCNKEAHYALFQLRDDFTKKWVQVCDKHDKETANHNGELLSLFPDKVWTEVK